MVGLLEIGGQLDGLLGFMHLADAQAITGMGSAVEGFTQGERRAQGPVHHGGGGPEISGHYVYISSWMSRQGYLYQTSRWCAP